MTGRLTHAARAVAALLLASLAACDRPGPLSAAARGDLPPPPAPPAWAGPLAGQPLASRYPGQARCVGSVDGTTERYRGARKVVGWAWNQGGRSVDRLVVVDAAGRMVGFGEGGAQRDDVPAARADVPSKTTGWTVIAPTTQRGYVLYGLDEAGRAACSLGLLRG